MIQLKKKILSDINKLEERLMELKAIINSDESGFSHLSLMKSIITEIMKKYY